jgi:hypothetical protein
MERIKRRAACVGLLVLSMLVAPAVASAATYNRWYLKNSNSSGIGQIAFNYGDGTQTPLAGDWNGDGVDTPGVFRSGTWWLSNAFDGSTQSYFGLGGAGYAPYVGDWNGDGITTVGVKTGANWYTINANSSTAARSTFIFGNPTGDLPLAGDWDGNGTQTPGIYRTTNHAFYLSNSPTGSLVSGIALGVAGDVPIVGDWNGDGKDSIGIYRPSEGRWYLSNGLDSTTEIAFAYGNLNDVPVVGDWDGNGTDTPGVVRTFTTPPPDPYPTSTQYGGANGAIDTDAERDATIQAASSLADSAVTAFWNGVRPAELDTLQTYLVDNLEDEDAGTASAQSTSSGPGVPMAPGELDPVELLEPADAALLEPVPGDPDYPADPAGDGTAFEQSVGYPATGCRRTHSVKHMRFKIIKVVGLTSIMETKFCWNRNTHRANVPSDPSQRLRSLDAYVPAWASVLGVKVTIHGLEDGEPGDQRAWNGHPKGQIAMSRWFDIEHCPIIKDLGCVTSRRLYHATYGHYDGTASARLGDR